MNKRIIGYDIARALAIFGMVIVNFKIVMGAEKNGPAWLIEAASLLNGRAAAVFVVLAGAGISLLSRQGRTMGDTARLAQDRRTLLKRACFLFVVGLLYTPLWPADILHFYGIYIGVAAFLLGTSSRWLWVSACGLVIGFVGLFLGLNYEQGWDFTTLEYSGLWTTTGLIRHLFFNGFHPVIPWLAFLLLGMVIGRQNVGSPVIRRNIFVWGICIALFAEVVSWQLVRTFSMGKSPAFQEVIVFLFGTEPMPPLPLYMLASAGTACALISACISLGERCEDARWIQPLVATGQLALTLYVAHIIIGMGVLEVFGRLENQTLEFTFGAAALFCVGAVVFSHAWKSRFKRGPLEWIMRRIAG